MGGPGRAGSWKLRRRSGAGSMASRPKRRALDGGFSVPRDEDEDDELENEDEDNEDSDEEEDEDDEVVNEVRNTRDPGLAYVWEKTFQQPKPCEWVSCLE